MNFQRLEPIILVFLPIIQLLVHFELKFIYAPHDLFLFLSI
jgi:hypothetical protein